MTRSFALSPCWRDQLYLQERVAFCIHIEVQEAGSVAALAWVHVDYPSSVAPSPFDW